MELFLNM